MDTTAEGGATGRSGQTTSGAHGSRTAPVLPRKVFGAPQVQNLSYRGIDAPTPARTERLPPPMGKYFLSKRKKVPKANAARRYGKRLLLPILTAGLTMSRAMEPEWRYHTGAERSCSPFPPSNGRAFSLRCLSPPAPAQLAGGILNPCGRMRRRKLNACATTKGQCEIQSTLAFSASHEARRRMAVFAVQLAGICTRPASREACRRAAVKLAKLHVLRPCARFGAHTVQRYRAARRRKAGCPWTGLPLAD